MTGGSVQPKGDHHVAAGGHDQSFLIGVVAQACGELVQGRCGVGPRDWWALGRGRGIGRERGRGVAFYLFVRIVKGTEMAATETCTPALAAIVG